MKKYTFYVLGRDRGAIGIFYWSYKTIEANNACEAEELLRLHFETICVDNNVVIEG